MPHAVIEVDLDLRTFAEGFRPIAIRAGSDVLRADQVFLELGGRALLIESLVVESARRQPFYIKVSRHERGTVTVRVDPLTHPDRSEGVRRLVAGVAEQILCAEAGASVVRTNLVIPSGGQGGRGEPGTHGAEECEE